MTPAPFPAHLSQKHSVAFRARRVLTSPPCRHKLGRILVWNFGLEIASVWSDAVMHVLVTSWKRRCACLGTGIAAQAGTKATWGHEARVLIGSPGLGSPTGVPCLPTGSASPDLHRPFFQLQSSPESPGEETGRPGVPLLASRRALVRLCILRSDSSPGPTSPARGHLRICCRSSMQVAVVSCDLRGAPSSGGAVSEQCGVTGPQERLYLNTS